MGKINLAEQIHVYPVLAPAAVTSATATYTNGVKMSRIGQGMLEFEVFFGAASATDSTGDYTLTVVESSAGVSTDGTAVPFMYRLSAAVGSDEMGAATTASTTGVSELATSVDNRVFLVYVDPAEVAEEYCHLLITPSNDSTSFIACAVARFVPAYAQATHLTCSTT